MSGETARQESGWTVDTLKQHYDKLREADQRALDAALLAVKEENRKTEVAAEKRFDLLNELRGDVATRQQIDALEKVVDELKDRLNRTEGESTGLQAGWIIFLGGLGATATIVSMVAVFSR